MYVHVHIPHYLELWLAHRNKAHSNKIKRLVQCFEHCQLRLEFTAGTTDYT